MLKPNTAVHRSISTISIVGRFAAVEKPVTMGLHLATIMPSPTPVLWPEYFGFFPGRFPPPGQEQHSAIFSRRASHGIVSHGAEPRQRLFRDGCWCEGAIAPPTQLQLVQIVLVKARKSS